MTKEDIEREAIELVSREKTAWDTGSAFVTEKVSYEMRNVWKKARKNYFGIFDEPKDKATGLDKIWVPITEYTVETYVKNIDLDTKDINVRATNPGEYRFTEVIRQIIRNAMERMGFGVQIDDGMRSLAIDGTWVQKSFSGYSDRFKKDILKSKKVDLLNLWSDPSARSLEETSVIERAILTPDDVRSYSDWQRTKEIAYKKDLNKNEEGVGENSSGEVPAIDVYERWGKMPKAFMTGKDEDKDTWIEGVITISGISSGNKLVHKIKENKKGYKPYDEAWLRRVPGRWAGRGIPEQLFSIQEYLNEVVNTRRNNNLILQNRLYQIRKGSGITPQKLSKLVAGGGVEVTAIDQDIKELPVSDQRSSSYKDQEVLEALSQKVTGAFDITAGESLPASTPATNAVLQNTNAKSSYTMVQEGVGAMLKNMIEQKWLPILSEVLSEEETMEILGDASSIRAIDEVFIKELLEDRLVKFVNENGFYPEEDQIEQFKEQARIELKRRGKGRFVAFRRELMNAGDYCVDVFVTNEDFEKSVVVKNLTDMLATYSRLTTTAIDADAIIKEILDILGLGGDRFFMPQKMANQMNGTPQMGQGNMQSQLLAASTNG